LTLLSAFMLQNLILEKKGGERKKKCTIREKIGGGPTCSNKKQGRENLIKKKRGGKRFGRKGER